MATQGLVSLLRLSYWELLNLPEKDRALKAELDRQRAREQPEQSEKPMSANLIRDAVAGH